MALPAAGPGVTLPLEDIVVADSGVIAVTRLVGELRGDYRKFFNGTAVVPQAQPGVYDVIEEQTLGFDAQVNGAITLTTQPLRYNTSTTIDNAIGGLYVYTATIQVSRQTKPVTIEFPFILDEQAAYTLDGDGNVSYDQVATDSEGVELTFKSAWWIDPTHPEFGAIGDGVTDDAPALNAALVAAKATKTTVFVPPGQYRTESTVLCEDDVSLMMHPYAEIRAAHGGTGVHIRNCNKGDYRVSVFKVDDLWYDDSGDTTSVGILLDDVFQNDFRFEAAGFATGLQAGADGVGCAYNTFMTPILQDSLVNLHARSENGGWCSSNTFVGGQYRHTSSSATYTGPDQRINHLVSGNNLKFENPSMEGTAQTERAIVCSNQWNVWDTPRLETGPTIEFTSSSSNNVIEWGYANYGPLDAPGSGIPVYINDGVRNKFKTHGGEEIHGFVSVNSPGYALQLSTDTLNLQPLLVGVRGKTGGAPGTRTFEITADGRFGMQQVGQPAGTFLHIQPPAAAGPAVWA